MEVWDTAVTGGYGMKDEAGLLELVMDTLVEIDKEFADTAGVRTGFLNGTLLRLTAVREAAFIKVNCASLLEGLVSSLPGRLKVIEECSFTFDHILLKVTFETPEGNSEQYRAVLDWGHYIAWRSLAGESTARTYNDNSTH